MDKHQFEHEMSIARTFQSLEPFRASYWNGVQRGLQRAYHGENFGTASEHALWMQAVDADDHETQQRGKGYRDGLQGSGRLTK